MMDVVQLFSTQHTHPPSPLTHTHSAHYKYARVLTDHTPCTPNFLVKRNIRQIYLKMEAKDTIITNTTIQTTNDTACNPIKSNHPKKNGKAARRKRKIQKAQSQYDGISFSKRESSGRPGTPLRFFSSSFNVQMSSSHDDRGSSTPRTCTSKVESDTCTRTIADGREALEESKLETTCNPHQIIHRHKNGLIIVTAGTALQNILATNTNTNTDTAADTAAGVTITDLKFKVQISNSQSVGSKRKKARKMKNGGGGGNDGFVEPNDTLAVVTFSNGSILDLKCCVAGTVMEINEGLVRDSFRDEEMEGKDNDDDEENVLVEKVEEEGGSDGVEQEVVQQKKRNLEEVRDCDCQSYSLLAKDPLLDGFLAVIMPSGFPEI